jgi:hypothetical protein
LLLPWVTSDKTKADADDGPEIRVKGRLVERLDKEFWHEHVIFANIDYASEGEEHKGQQILIYQDRVFWPCDG